MSSRGRGGKFNKPKRGGARHFSNFRENPEGEQWNKPRENPEESSSSSEEEEDAPVSQNLIETNNLNAPKKANLKLTDLNGAENVELSRREREQVEKERAKAAYWKAQMEGKTDQARSDLARLAIIKKQREEAAARKLADAQSKSGPTGSKGDSLNAGKSIISKSLN